MHFTKIAMYLRKDLQGLVGSQTFSQCFCSFVSDRVHFETAVVKTRLILNHMFTHVESRIHGYMHSPFFRTISKVMHCKNGSWVGTNALRIISHSYLSSCNVWLVLRASPRAAPPLDPMSFQSTLQLEIHTV